MGHQYRGENRLDAVNFGDTRTDDRENTQDTRTADKIEETPGQMAE